MGRLAKKAFAKPYRNYVCGAILFVVAVYLVLYFVYVYPLSRLHIAGQSKKWATDIFTNTILGAKDASYLQKIRKGKIDNLSFYYNYFFFHTSRYTIYVVFNLHNKYSNAMTLNVYSYDFEHKTNHKDDVQLDFRDLKTSKSGDTLVVTCGKAFVQKLNIPDNKMEITIRCGTMHLSFELAIDDYTTNFPTFLPRYDAIKGLVPTYNQVTSTPGEWCTDNPLIGKIKGGVFNGDRIEEEGGNFWFDNFIGVNDFFLLSYTWYMVLNDDWMIYLLWFGEYEKKEKSCFFIIKDRKADKVIRAGIDGSYVPAFFKPLDNLVDPVKSTYTSNKNMGVKDYDSFSSIFATNEITIKFTSIPGHCHQLFMYDYYDAAPTEEVDSQERFDIVNNVKYTEYITRINVEIEYQGRTERFEERCVVDAMFKFDKTVPDTF